MTLLSFLTAWLIGTFVACALALALAAWRHGRPEPGPDLVERRERAGVQPWESS